MASCIRLEALCLSLVVPGEFVAADHLASDSVLVDNARPDHASTRAIPCHGQRKRVAHELKALLLGHALLELAVTVAVDVCRARSANGEGLAHQRAAKGNAEHLATLLSVPASHNNAGLQAVLVVVAEVTEERRRSCHARSLAQLHAVGIEVVLDDVGDGLGISGGARAAAIDALVHGRELVRHAVGDVGAGGRARVGTHHHSSVEGHCHDGRAHVVLLTHPLWDLCLGGRGPRRLHSHC
mmetsp:Transcript_100714/g.139938  ORF Transcript_100714/g.139938 Transcript_100714/m.139938 type:complete len:240 (+) Transcript_100714:1-720(+)